MFLLTVVFIYYLTIKPRPLGNCKQKKIEPLYVMRYF